MSDLHLKSLVELSAELDAGGTTEPQAASQAAGAPPAPSKPAGRTPVPPAGRPPVTRAARPSTLKPELTLPTDSQ